MVAMVTAQDGFVPDEPQRIKVKYRRKSPRNFPENEKAQMNLR
jgi:hypothetical protein